MTRRKIYNIWLTLTCPLRRKLQMRQFFDVSKVKESNPLHIFDAHLLENTNWSPSCFDFQLVFIKIIFWVRWLKAYSNEWVWKKMMFIHTNQSLITSFYIKRCLFLAELAMSQCWSAIFCVTGVWGGKAIGRVRVKNRNESNWSMLTFRDFT